MPALIQPICPQMLSSSSFAYLRRLSKVRLLEECVAAGISIPMNSTKPDMITAIIDARLRPYLQRLSKMRLLQECVAKGIRIPNNSTKEDVVMAIIAHE